jgi:hypothetical protein
MYSQRFRPPDPLSSDHEGVPNTQLQKEHPTMANDYKQKAIAEQHSVDVGWLLLMEDRFQDLRNEIYKDDEELRLFRQLIVNIIMATGKTVDRIANFNFLFSASFSP